MYELDAEETKKHLDSSSSSNGVKEYTGPIFGIIGVIIVNNIEFVCVINEIQACGSVHNMKEVKSIHLIKNVMLFPIQSLDSQDKNEKAST